MTTVVGVMVSVQLGTREWVAKNNPPGTHAGIVHATDFMSYAYLQLGQDAKAKALIEDMASVKKIFGPQGPGAMGASAVPAAAA